MSNARRRRLAILLWSISFILLGCGRQDSSLTATPTPSPTGQLTEQPGVESTPPSTSPTADLEATPLTAIPYPEPRQGSVVTKEPVFDPSITPSEEPLSTATPSALPTEAGTPLPPPYPGDGTQRPDNTPANPPPYPITTRTLTPTPTLEESGPTATTQPGVLPTATSEDGSPTATDQPEVTATPNATFTPVFTPTITPTPRPPVEPRLVDVVCVIEGPGLRCEDEITELTFVFPIGWAQSITGRLRPGETGVQYLYNIERSFNPRPELLEAGGVSWDFTQRQEGFLTEFSGFLTDTLSDRCGQFQGVRICEALSAEVLLAYRFPDADQFCQSEPTLLPRPLALVAVDLPANELVNGFVFVGDFLSDAFLAEFEKDLEDLIETAELPGESCDAYRKSRFNVRMLELVAAVRNEILDLPTLVSVSQWRQLGESLLLPEE